MVGCPPCGRTWLLSTVTCLQAADRDARDAVLRAALGAVVDNVRRRGGGTGLHLGRALDGVRRASRLLGEKRIASDRLASGCGPRLDCCGGGAGGICLFWDLRFSNAPFRCVRICSSMGSLRRFVCAVGETVAPAEGRAYGELGGSTAHLSFRSSSFGFWNIRWKRCPFFFSWQSYLNCPRVLDSRISDTWGIGLSLHVAQIDTKVIVMQNEVQCVSE